MKNVLVLLFTAFTIFSCSRADSIRKKMSGTWNFSKIEAFYYTDGLIDSTKIIEENGTWDLIDDGQVDYNDFIYRHSKVNPRSISSVAIATGRAPEGGQLEWYSDEDDDQRLVVWKLAQDGYTEPRVVFTVLENTNSSLILQYVVSDDANNPRNLKFKEVITLTK